MNRRDFFILFLLGFIVPLITIQFQSLPGYMDADYYFGGGVQLVKGNGFTEPYLWNYLNDPGKLPVPSHAYWMPLASMLSALGMFLAGNISYSSARIGFVLLTALIPPLTSLLAFRITSRRTLSYLAGLLACFPIYYSPFLPVTDNYSIYMVLGILFFYLLTALPDSGNPILQFFLLGVVSSLMTLARADGLLWLGISFLIAIWHGVHSPKSTSGRSPPSPFWGNFLKNTLAILFGFILLMAPWFARNLSTFGALTAPGGNRVLWLREYNDTFLYPSSGLTIRYLLESGRDAILQARLRALGLNLLNTFAAQGGIFLFPFILIGLWSLRNDYRIRFAAAAWLILFGTMSFLFPFAGARGAFFHAGAALQPVWWAAAPLGFDEAITSMRRRGWFDDRAYVIFRSFFVGIVILMTAVIFNLRVLSGWEREDGKYASLGEFLNRYMENENDVAIVRNPPGFSIVTGVPSIALPSNGIDAIFKVAARYHARFLILEPEGTSVQLRSLYDDPNQSPKLKYLGESDGIRIFEIIQ